MNRDKTKEELLSELVELKQERDSLKTNYKKRIIERRQELEILKRFNTIFEQSPIAIELYDSEGSLLNVNAACLNLFGVVNSNEIAGFKLFEDPNLSDDLKEKIFNKETVRYDVEFNFEKVKKLNLYQTSCSGIKYLDCSVSPLTEGNLVVGFIVQIQDNTRIRQTEKLLQQTSQNYETFFNTIDEFLFVLNPQGNIIHTNSTVLNRLGYTHEDLLGKSGSMVHPPERYNDVGRIIDEMLRGVTDYCTIPLLTKSGVQIPVETRVSKGFWDGKPGLFVVSKDMSKVILSEEKFSKLFHINPSACGLTELDNNRYIDVNEAFYSLLGFDKDEVIGKTTEELGILTTESINAVQLKADSNGKVINVEANLKAKNGDIRNVLLFAENIHIQEQKYRFTVVQDITERKKAESKLLESEEKYRTLVQYSGDPIFSFNPDETYRFVNEVFAKTFGKAPGDIIGKRPYDIFPYEEAEKRLELVRKVLKSGQNGEIEVKVVTSSGNEMYYITTADPVRDENGKICWVSCISKNITERKRAELALKESERRLHQLNADKDRFISILGHDLRTPFNSLLGLSAVLSEKIQEYDILKIKKIAGDINKTAQNAFNLLEDILLWARIQQGSVPFNPRRLSLEEICKNSVEVLKPNADAKNITIRYWAEGIHVFADSDMIRTVFRNIVSNAIKFTDNGGVINIKAEKKDENVTISVSDNGIGIQPEDLTKLFNISEVFTTMGTSGEKGTGLGLLLCKDFIEKHNGKILLKSEVGKGTDFVFILPYESQEMMA